ncbi:MAG: hypothetical protein JRH20_14830 [Deltaproteobacteria bacterium]|nr:hypothetical protein [Deltaproteobacteria bacterium]
MKNLLIVGALLATVAGCPAKRGILTPPKISAENIVKIELPKTISAKSEKRALQLYESLPSYHPQRKALRALLRGRFLERAHTQLALPRGEDDALKAFYAMARLHDPSNVFDDKCKDPELAKLALRLAKRFSLRGDIPRTLPALTVAIGLAKKADRKKLQKEFWRAIRWQEDTLSAMYGKGIKGHRVIPAMEAAVVIWPTAFALDALTHIYLEQRAALSGVTPLRGMLRRHGRFHFPALRRAGYNIARIYLWADRPEKALEWLRTLPANDRDTRLIRLLEQVLSPSAHVDDALRLADEFEERNSQISLRLCRRAASLHPRQAQAHLCVGRLAKRAKNTLLAVRAYERAHALDPSNASVAEQLARQYQSRVFLSVDSEALRLAHRQLEELIAFHGRLAKKGIKLKTSLSAVHYAVGFGLYNAGEIALARRSFERSIAAKPSAQTLVQLARVQLKSGDAKGALGYLKRAEKLPMKTIPERLFWQGRIDGLAGEALAMLGRVEESRTRHQQAVTTWTRWTTVGLKPKSRAETYVYLARSLFTLDNRMLAIEALEKAIDAAPGRKQTYPEAISLLARYGHLPEALDAYHRALGRDEVGEYLKTYCSLWVVGLARRAKVDPDPLAMAYLQKLKGTHFYHHLTKMVLGELSYAQLLAKTKDRAQQAELFYYRAEQLLAEGKLADAKDLWKRVLGTKMMAFFEFDIAQHQLRMGPAKVRKERFNNPQKASPTKGNP